MDQLSLFGASTGTMRVETTNSKDYLPHWDTVSAVKELIQNAVYAKTVLGAKIKLEHDGRLAHISDNAQGFTMDKLLIGNSEQREFNFSPGFFGEGMKLSLLISARQNKECRFETVGFSVQGSIEEGVLGPNTFILYVSPNKRKRGTDFSIECTEEEFTEACKSFAVLNGVLQSHIMAETLLSDTSSKVYVAGVLVSEPLSLWGYNLMDKSLINRDRTTVDHDLLIGRVREVLSNISKPALAEQLLRAVADDQSKTFLEVTACLSGYSSHYNDKQKKMWKAAARKVFGSSKLCLSSGDEYDTTARYRNFTLITGINYEWREFFDCVLDIPYSRNIARVAKKTKRKAITLTPEEKRLLGKYKRAIGAFYADCGKVKVAEDLMDSYSNPCSGLYDGGTGTIWLNRWILESEEELFTTLLHETNHRQSGATDNTVAFTEAWEFICWNLYNSRQRRRVAKPANLPVELAAK